MCEIRTNDQTESSKILDHRTGGFILSTDDTLSFLAIGKKKNGANFLVYCVGFSGGKFQRS